MKRLRSTDGRPILSGPAGLQIPLHDLAAAALLIVIGLVLSAISINLGVTRVALANLVTGELSASERYALFDVRLPRILLGFMAGWSVAIAGAVLQSLARNPLADPGLLGISQGSMVTIMLLLVFLPTINPTFIPIAALIGGLAVALALILLTGRQAASGLAVLLMGIAIETSLSSILSILLLYLPPDLSYAMADWLAGSLSLASLGAAISYLPWFAASIVCTLLIGPKLRVIELGPSLALSLGEPTGRTQPLALLGAVLISSAAVTAVGPLIFLGVMAPHLSNFISPATGRARLVLSGLTGGLLVIAADILTRALPGTIGLPIGLGLTLVGVPLFILTLRLRTMRENHIH
ncbi:FecCD family ABC transporter permease [Notoacmeibacter ruber]|uniref:Iron ABC transporter permease n=1 Tax=Notoacmeibacter ruber TaxID=2670375 RepID=A0A3L7J9P5_9HYPH|nr:iron ABC transporter permease [Notoacmeibacter ruber]RLQ85222.1 iron ABC transporter permease [Notoacmeibacter ruber]